MNALCQSITYLASLILHIIATYEDVYRIAFFEVAETFFKVHFHQTRVPFAFQNFLAFMLV